MYTGPIRCDSVLYTRYLLLHCCCKRNCSGPCLICNTVEVRPVPDLVKLVITGQKPVERKLVKGPKTNEECNGHTCCQACNIEEGESLIAKQVSPGDLTIVLKHKSI